jgi:hypothetical protein
LNYHEDFSSMLMAVGVALAMAAYVALLYSMPVPSPRTGGHRNASGIAAGATRLLKVQCPP